VLVSHSTQDFSSSNILKVIIGPSGSLQNAHCLHDLYGV